MELRINMEEWELVLRRNISDHDRAVQMRAYMKTLAGKVLMRSVSLLGTIKLMTTDSKEKSDRP